jgi:L-ascorbate metabolism protein UlaG (beta-lactamase superfamily)
MRLTWLGHASLVLDLDGVRILTDPLLGRHSGPLRRRGPVPRSEQWRDARAVLVSHLHHDHAELSSLRRVAAPVLTADANAGFLRRRGLTAHGLGEGWGRDWHQVDSSDVRVRLTRAVHGDRPMPHRPNQANGHLVVGSGLRVWVAGDTDLYPELERVPELAGGEIDLAVVPVWGWGPRLSGGHLTPATAAEACRAVGAKAALPYHWGTFHPPFLAGRPAGWMDLPGRDFAEGLERRAPGCRALVLDPGGTVEL